MNQLVAKEKFLALKDVTNHLTTLKYIPCLYEDITAEKIGQLKYGHGYRLENKSKLPFFVRRKLIFDRKNSRYFESTTSFEVENGFGNIIASGSAATVYNALYTLTDSDVPF